MRTILLLLICTILLITPALATENYTNQHVDPHWSETAIFWRILNVIPFLGASVLDIVQYIGTWATSYWWMLIPQPIITYVHGIGFYFSMSDNFLPTYYAAFLGGIYFEFWFIFTIIRTIKHFIPLISG